MAVIGQGDDGTGLGRPIPPRAPAVTSIGTRQDVSIGGIALDETQFEVPGDFSWGHETWMSTHRIPQTGNTQAKIITQTWGVFPIPIEFEARFLRQNVLKYRQLVGLQVAQQVISLTVGSLSWDVVIEQLQMTQRSRFDIGFKIKVVPLRDRSGVAPSGNSVGVNAGTQLINAYQGLMGALT